MKKTLSLLLALVMLFSLGISAFAADAPAEETDALVVDTMILMEADDNMINNYTLLAVNPEAPFVDADGLPRRTTALPSTANTSSISRKTALFPRPTSPKPPRRRS